MIKYIKKFIIRNIFIYTDNKRYIKSNEKNICFKCNFSLNLWHGKKSSLAKFTAREEIKGYLQDESWKGLGWSTIIAASVYRAQKLVRQLSRKHPFFENHKKLNQLKRLVTAGIFLAPQLFNFKKYKQLAQTTKIEDFEISNKYYFFNPNPLKILLRKITKNSNEEIAAILEKIDEFKATLIFLDMLPKEAAKILKKISPKQEAEILQNMDEDKAKKILSL